MPEVARTKRSTWRRDRPTCSASSVDRASPFVAAINRAASVLGHSRSAASSRGASARFHIAGNRTWPNSHRRWIKAQHVFRHRYIAVTLPIRSGFRGKGGRCGCSPPTPSANVFHRGDDIEGKYADGSLNVGSWSSSAIFTERAIPGFARRPNFVFFAVSKTKPFGATPQNIGALFLGSLSSGSNRGSPRSLARRGYCAACAARYHYRACAVGHAVTFVASGETSTGHHRQSRYQLSPCVAFTPSCHAAFFSRPGSP